MAILHTCKEVSLISFILHLTICDGATTVRKRREYDSSWDQIKNGR